MQSYTRQDGEFGAGVESIDVFSRIGFGEPKLLRFTQSGREGNAVGFDLAENVIAGPVQNSADPEQVIAGQSLLQSGNYWDASGYRCSKLNLLFHLPRQGEQFGAAPGNELLVSGDHRLARLERAPDPLFCGMKAADDLDHDIGGGR